MGAPLTNVEDGGGIRGLSSLYIIKRLMEKIQEEEKHQSRDATGQLPTKSLQEQGNDGQRISPSQTNREVLRSDQLPLPCHYFDFIVGTSTGG